MAIKEYFRSMQPYQLYVMVVLTATYFVAQLVVSHMAHALTLLVDACHMMCNLIALSGCIITIQKSSRNSLASEPKVKEEPLSNGGEKGTTSADTPCQNHLGSSVCERLQSVGDRRMRNTFGWARIDVLVMLICCVFLASLCFSLVVEALQLLIHIDFHDEMHHPIPVICVAAVGILLNGVCYLMIGGYTFHQGSFLHVTESGDVVLDNKISKDSLKRGQRRLSKQARRPAPRAIHATPRQGFREMFRDIIGCLFVIACSIIVFYTNENIAKYVDPIMAIISAVVLLSLSYPYMKESGLILLQTIPDHINIDAMKQKLLKEFPDILNVHEFHVWQLTSSKVISTAHIIFLNPKDYTRIINDITDFFLEQGITHLTIQPEFYKIDSGSNLTALPLEGDYECLVSCKEDFCQSQHCCSSKSGDLASISIGHGHSHGHSHHGHSHSAPKPLPVTQSKESFKKKCEDHKDHSHGHSHSSPKALSETPKGDITNAMQENGECEDHKDHSHGHSHSSPKALSVTPKENITNAIQENGECEDHKGLSHGHSHSSLIVPSATPKENITNAIQENGKCEDHKGHSHEKNHDGKSVAVMSNEDFDSGSENGKSEQGETVTETLPAPEEMDNIYEIIEFKTIKTDISAEN